MMKQNILRRHCVYLFNTLFIACRKFGAPYIGKAITDAIAALSINESIILYFRQ